MKKLPLTLLVAFLILNIYSVHAQDSLKEGKVTMNISFPDAGDKADAMKSVMGSQSVIYFKNKSSRTEMKMSMGTMIMIVNGKKGENYTLMNMMGMKYALKVPMAQRDSLLKATNSKLPKIKLTKDTKKVLGYNCKRATITTQVKGKKQVVDYWYTTEINSTMASLSPVDAAGKPTGIKGFPVETTMKLKNMTVVMTLAAIDKIPVADSMFEIPADYPIKTMDELKQGLMSKFKSTNDSLSSKYKSIHDGTASDTAASLFHTVSGPFPEIEMNDVNGNPLKLSSLRGKYVLVDFWASWCEPCRAQSPALVKAYKNYKDKGFTIYSVSLDKDKDKWLKAIANDNLSWENHVCDFKGWDSAICLQLDIKGIPMNYLLDKEGNIIAIGLFDDGLEKTLKEKIK